MKRIVMAIFLVMGIGAANGFCHFPMLLHDAPLAQVNQAIQVWFAVGHPFEQEYEDAQRPEKLVAVIGMGGKVDLTAKLTEWKKTVGDQSVAAWQVNYTPDAAGDVILALDTAPDISKSGKNLFQEYLKTYIHVEREIGWDRRTGQPLEIVPLTRPYGLQEGFVFTGRLMKGEEPVPDVKVYVEQKLSTPPKAEDLPPEPLITAVVKTDERGYFSHTLPNAGWYILGAFVDQLGTITRDGKTYTHDGFAGIWVHVEKRIVMEK